ncbi:MAG: alpha/beta fold hydrolase [Syntrophaceae bacterium]|nr:alpha/beta fold hydrolase [Syntrophaceae bacterium]
MPFVENNGVKIYFEARGQGHPIVLLHGFTGNLQQWKLAGYSSRLEKSYRVILIDQRGHGQSDKPHDAGAYSLNKRMEDVISVLDHLDIKKVILFGYSMGGWLAFALAVYFPGRVAGLVIDGAHPFEDNVDEFTGVDGSDSNIFLRALASFIGEEIAPEFQPIILQNDLVAVSAAAQPRESLEKQLPCIKAPCLLFAGEADKRFEKIKLCAEKLPNAKFLMVPSAGHAMALFKADVVLPAVIGFLKRSFPTRQGS